MTDWLMESDDLHMHEVMMSYSSHSSWTSRCLLWGASFMAKMGEPGTSPCTCLKAIRTSSSFITCMMGQYTFVQC